MKILALLAARGGSKGVARKNLAPVAGKPLIAWVLEEARRCAAIDDLVVTTDDAEIAAVARDFGARTPFLRPAHLAQDDTPGMAPLLHALRWLIANEGSQPDLVMPLQATSPLPTAADMNAAISLLQERRAEAVISVTPVAHHPYWTKRLDAAGRLTDFIAQEQPVRRRQDLPPAYALNGALELVRTGVLLERPDDYARCALGLVLPAERALDIDTPWDLHLADLILKARRP
jgi:CMP-N,N'-diacetyllegionaminic acid synthase